jgi:ribonuclease Z
MILISDEQTVLIDCSRNPITRLSKIGVDRDQVTDLILTHFHPDHVSGVGVYLMNIWLLGRRKPMNIYGLAHTIDRTEKMMDFFDWATWPNFFQVNFHRLPDREMAPVLEGHDLQIFSSPVHHIVPTIGLRVEFKKEKKLLAYSCDTEPCTEVERLAAGSDVLIHEASGASFGHTSAAQAGQLARKAGAGRLYLIHYPTGEFQSDSLVPEATETFNGPVSLAEDFMEIEF